MDCTTPGSSVLCYLPEFAQIHVLSNHLILSAAPPLLFNPSQHQRFPNELALCIRGPKYWSFRISISPSNEYSRLICFKVDWFDLLAVLGTPKSLLQHHGWKASVLQFSHIHTRLQENHNFDYVDLCWQSDVSTF